MGDVPFLQNDPYHPEAAADTELGALSRTIKTLSTGLAREAGAVRKMRTELYNLRPSVSTWHRKTC